MNNKKPMFSCSVQDYLDTLPDNISPKERRRLTMVEYGKKRRKLIKESDAYEDFKVKRRKYQVEFRIKMRKEPIRYLWKKIQDNTRSRGEALSFESLDDFLKDIGGVVPTYCPILGIPLKISDGKLCDGSISIDRIDSSKGYIRGNIAIISSKANTIKNFGTAEDHLAIYNWMMSKRK